MKKRLFAGTAAVLLAAVLFLPVNAQEISAEKAILMDAATGRILYEKNCDSQSLIASTTKIMTALVVCEQCNVLDRMRIPNEAVGIEGSSMYLQAGEVLTVQELLYGMMLHSGNDAAVALAIYCGGTVEGFAEELMNDKARSLGMKDTHFVNPNGLDAPGHYSTARDLAILACYAMENPIFRQTAATKTISIGNRYLRNHNKLLWQFDGADGVKTGFTKAAGRILVSSAVKDGRRLVAVTINAPDDWRDHTELLASGFSGFTVQRIVCVGQVLGEVEIAGGQLARVELIAAKEFDYPLADGEMPEIRISGPGFVYAPVVSGAEAGVAQICLGEKSVGKIPLFYGETIEAVPDVQKSFWNRFFGG